MQLSPEQEQRFWGRVDRTPSCWLWTHTVDHRGYGRFWHAGRVMFAHRIAYALTYGPIPPGEGYHGTCVCHRCDTPLCVRPDHLFLGTTQDNTKDRDTKGRTARRPGLNHHNTKHGADARARALSLGDAGVTQAFIARQVGMSQAQVWRILHGVQRAHS